MDKIFCTRVRQTCGCDEPSYIKEYTTVAARDSGFLALSKKVKNFLYNYCKCKIKYLSLHRTKEIRIMTQAELNFYEGVPRTLREIAAQLKALNDNIKKLTEKVENLED